MNAIHVVADLLQDEELSVATIIDTEISSSIDDAQHDVTDGDNAVSIEAVQHETVLHVDRVAVVDNHQARVLVARVKRHVWSHLLVAVNGVDSSSRLR